MFIIIFSAFLPLFFPSLFSSPPFYLFLSLLPQFHYPPPLNQIPPFLLLSLSLPPFLPRFQSLFIVSLPPSCFLFFSSSFLFMSSSFSLFPLPPLPPCLFLLSPSLSLQKFSPRASSGHAWNQSMVQQLIRDGNFLTRLRKASPIGLKARITWSFSRQRETKKLKRESGVCSVSLFSACANGLIACNSKFDTVCNYALIHVSLIHPSRFLLLLIQIVFLTVHLLIQLLSIHLFLFPSLPHSLLSLS